MFGVLMFLGWVASTVYACHCARRIGYHERVLEEIAARRARFNAGTASSDDVREAFAWAAKRQLERS